MLTATEFYSHFYHAMKKEANTKLWMLTAASQPHRDEKGQREVLQQAEEIGYVGGTTRKRQWEMVDKSAGVDMIGLDIKIHGEEWLDAHPDAKEFLSNENITPAEAVALHEKWRKELFARMGRDEQGKMISTEGKKFTSLLGQPLVS